MIPHPELALDSEWDMKLIACVQLCSIISEGHCWRLAAFVLQSPLSGEVEALKDSVLIFRFVFMQFISNVKVSAASTFIQNGEQIVSLELLRRCPLSGINGHPAANRN